MASSIFFWNAFSCCAAHTWSIRQTVASTWTRRSKGSTPNQVRYEASDNAPFTPAERAEISKRFDEIKAILKEDSALARQQLSRIEKTLDEAEKASSRLG